MPSETDLKAVSTTESLPSDRSRGLLAVADQLIVSGTNFAIVAALGRFAGAETLGQFSIGYSVVVIATTMMRSLIMTPYAVFSHRESEDHRRAMRGCVLLSTAAIALVTALVTTIAAAIIYWIETRAVPASTAMSETHRSFGPLFCLVALTLPAWTLRELARQMSFADMKFARAMGIDIIVSVGQLVAITVLVFNDALTAESVMLVLAVSTTVVGVGWLLRIKQHADFDYGTLRTEWHRTWRFGRWGAMSQTSHVTQGYALNWILAWTGGLAAAGVYAAVWSVVQLASPFIQGVGNALTPLLAKRRSSGGVDLVVNTTKKFTRLAAIAAALYLIAMYLIGPLAIRMIYGSEYADTTLLLVLLAGSVAVSAIVLIATKVISVLEYPHINFVLNLASLVMTIVLAAVLGYYHGIHGAALGLLLAALLAAGAKWISYLYVIRHCTAPGNPA